MKQNDEIKKEIIVPRITQIDANYFDNEINKILFNQILEVSKFLKPGALNNFKSELNFILNLVIYKYSILQKNSTFGQDLVGLKYNDSFKRTKLYLYPILKYFFPYLKKKYEENGTRVNNNVMLLKNILKISQFLNLLVFLVQGKYPTISDRLLNLKYVPTKKYNRSVGYHFMTRQLVWFSILELLKLILPLVNYSKIKSKISTLVFSKFYTKRIKIHTKYKNSSKCVICKDYLILPCTISEKCSHLACYYCLKVNNF
ncbi:conserved hypothetical protein [Pediculus humanus corporis]|uniref:RING-type E3 ubiquitin transferase (cysteine targeting) n=1 Tax=Pediculus humanus subsp. corporis TaxID=121224 RepID=E0W356_PEDHC|nr:uncharacterized protein Phum_PHUM601520 [Pediculus humanus corporis]EEB20062.1 conserved hypothetical protein [Pediculus humanus corporis]